MRDAEFSAYVILKGMGLCNEVFTPEILEGLHGDIGIGHVRYSTAGSSTRENAKPLVLNYVKGTLALAMALGIQCQDQRTACGGYPG